MLLLRPRVLAALALLLLAAQASAQGAPAIGAPDTATLRSIQAQVTQIRGLQQISDTPLRLLDHQARQSYLIDQFSRNYLPRERESDQKELEALGRDHAADALGGAELDLGRAGAVSTPASRAPTSRKLQACAKR